MRVEIEARTDFDGIESQAAVLGFHLVGNENQGYIVSWLRSSC